eukprot:1941594-Pyramimonas_sp.AAC.2
MEWFPFPAQRVGSKTYCGGDGRNLGRSWDRRRAPPRHCNEIYLAKRVRRHTERFVKYALFTATNLQIKRKELRDIAERRNDRCVVQSNGGIAATLDKLERIAALPPFLPRGEPLRGRRGRVSEDGPEVLGSPRYRKALPGGAEVGQEGFR